MLVQINSDNQLKVGEMTIDDMESTLRDKLDRFAQRLTRIEVHLRDVNANSNVGDDKHCTIEARPNGLDPITVTDAAGNISAAVSGATAKMIVALERSFGKLSSRKGH
jgi:ribosome-associated translation inhibitor RaiA